MILPLVLVLTLVAACAAAPQMTETSGLSFIHLNDTYRIGAVEDGTAGGFGRVVTVVRDLQRAGKDVRLLHGGDFLYPSLESQLWHGEQMIDALNYLNALAPLYVVAGNHEFDDRRTSEYFENAVRQSEFMWLGDNYRFATHRPEVDKALYPTYTVQHDDKTVGFFALTLHPDDGGNLRDYVPIQKDYVGHAKKAIAKLEDMGVDAIVGLTHLHMWQDRDIAALRAAHPTFVLVAGGHEHEPEFEPLSSQSAAVVKGASNAREIWRVDLNFDAAGMPTIETHAIALDRTIASDTDYQKVDDKWRAALLEKFPFLEAKIGEAALPMDAREVTVRNGESSWGNFIADQMRGAFGEASDFAFLNSGTLRIDDWIEDDILFEDIGRTFGFSSHLRYLTLTGEEFSAVMEAGYRGFGPSKGYFPQVSGFRVCIDPSRAEFSRIVSLQVPTDGGWQPIDPQKRYSLIVPDFLFGGGDGYNIPKNRPSSRPGSELKYRVLDAILAAQAGGQPVGEAITQQNRRFHRLLEAKEPCIFGE